MCSRCFKEVVVFVIWSVAPISTSLKVYYLCLWLDLCSQNCGEFHIHNICKYVPTEGLDLVHRLLNKKLNQTKTMLD